MVLPVIAFWLNTDSFSLSTLNSSSYSLLPCNISAEKKSIRSLRQSLLCMKSQYSLPAFKILSLSLIFNILM
jgi:hypothetical protein